MLLVLLPPPNFSEGNRTTLKSPPTHHLSPHRPYTLANSTQKSFLSLGLQGP
ncbi:hypothetical protein LguiA_008485 [Lonicera macranthoides]